jgi:hypothetical protein
MGGTDRKRVVVSKNGRLLTETGGGKQKRAVLMKNG